MVNTLAHLRAEHSEKEFVLVIGSDNWNGFSQWKSHDEILLHHSVLVYPRPGYPVEKKSLSAGVFFVDAPQFDVSSTLIRTAIYEKRDIRYLVHSAVWREIVVTLSY
jgi:nicotinate-nucleotide adenylyltransferase